MKKVIIVFMVIVVIIGCVFSAFYIKGILKDRDEVKEIAVLMASNLDGYIYKVKKVSYDFNNSTYNVQVESEDNCELVRTFIIEVSKGHKYQVEKIE